LRYRATLAYVGTFFHGWQIQENVSRTIQAEVEKALTHLFAAPVRVHASGRTDAGVHAEGQVIHFDASGKSSDEILGAANRFLPWDVRFLDVERADPDFHARNDARAKRYVYRFSRARVIPPARTLFVAPLSRSAEPARMAEGARRLLGTHDFFAFSTSGTETETTVRTMHACEVVEQGSAVDILLTADGFLRGMARAIAGTLADVGRGHVPVDLVGEILESKDRTLVRPKAKARGLTLERVFYAAANRGAAHARLRLPQESRNGSPRSGS
jgi:tRNA pseudouridine38-40 synthase